jgi:hypothetical protein
MEVWTMKSSLRGVDVEAIRSILKGSPGWIPQLNSVRLSSQVVTDRDQCWSIPAMGAHNENTAPLRCASDELDDDVGEYLGSKRDRSGEALMLTRGTVGKGWSKHNLRFVAAGELVCDRIGDLRIGIEREVWTVLL